MIHLKQVIADWRKQFPDDVDLTTPEMILLLCEEVERATRAKVIEAVYDLAESLGGIVER